MSLVGGTMCSEEGRRMRKKGKMNFLFYFFQFLV